MNLSKLIKDLCTPAYVYFILSSISVLIYIYYMNRNGINNDHTMGGLVFNVVYYLFWTWVLNLICNSTFLKNKVGKNAGQVISWLLVLFPIVFMIFFMILFFMYAGSLSAVKEEVESEEGNKEINKMNILYGNQAPQLSQFESGLRVN